MKLKTATDEKTEAIEMPEELKLASTVDESLEDAAEVETVVSNDKETESETEKTNSDIAENPEKETATQDETSETSAEDASEQKEDPIAIENTDIKQSELDELKKTYKKLYQTFYVDKVYVWHRLNRRTFTSICEDTKDIENDDEMVREREVRFCKAAIVYPRAEELAEDVSDEVIGTKLAQEILYKSGFYRPVTMEV